MVGVTQAQTPDPLTLRDRLLAATYRCVSRFGLGKTTIDDVAKESGLSRATIYRQFPGGREFKSVQELNRYRKELQASLGAGGGVPDPA